MTNEYDACPTCGAIAVAFGSCGFTYLCGFQTHGLGRRVEISSQREHDLQGGESEPVATPKGEACAAGECGELECQRAECLSCKSSTTAS